MEGYKLLARTLELAQELRQQINATGVFRVLELDDLLPEEVQHDGIQLDPTKVTVDISTLRLHGRGAAAASCSSASTSRSRSRPSTPLTLLLTIGTTRSKVSRLYDALMRIAREGRAPRRLYQAPGHPRLHRAAASCRATRSTAAASCCRCSTTTSTPTPRSTAASAPTRSCPTRPASRCWCRGR